MTQRLVRLSALVIAAVFAAAAYHLTRLPTTWVTAVHVFVSLALGAGVLGTIVATLAGAPRLSLAIAAGLLGAQVIILVTSVVGVRWIPLDLVPDARLNIAVAVALAIAVAGLVADRMWARYLALALAAVGIGSSGLNAVTHWRVTMALDANYPQWTIEMMSILWALLVNAIGGALVVTNLMTPAVRARFAERRANATWTSGHAVVGWVRASILTSFFAVPMLLVYAWVQPIVPATATSAVVLAAALALGGALALRGRLVGALVLCAAGVGLLAQLALTYRGAPADQHSIVAYYAVFFVPAAVVAIATGVKLARPTLRLLRG